MATDNISYAIDIVRERLPGLKVSFYECLRDHTSFRIGGAVRAMFFPESAGEMTELFMLLDSNGVAPLVLGNGTNILADDRVLDIVVIKTAGLRGIRQTGGDGGVGVTADACVTADAGAAAGAGATAGAETTADAEITAEAGVPLSKLAVFACERGLTGLETIHGIPGTLGGAVLMNAGAYGAEMKDIVIRVDAILHGTGPVTIDRRGLDFSYRHSCFSDNGGIILSSVMKLQKGDPAGIKASMDTYASRRRESQPLELPSAGSVFKRPADGYAGALIEQSGLKGYACGSAQVSPKHAGFIVNNGGASFSDVMAVINHIRETVKRNTGIVLDTEIKIINR